MHFMVLKKGLQTVYGLEKGLVNGPLKGQLVMDDPENAVL